MKRLTLMEAMLLAIGDIHKLLFTYQDIQAEFISIGPEFATTPEGSVRKTVSMLLKAKKLKRIGKIFGTNTAVYSKDMNMMSLEGTPPTPDKSSDEVITELDEDMSIDEVLEALKIWILTHVDNTDDLHNTINQMQDTLAAKSEEIIEMKKQHTNQMTKAITDKREAEMDLKTITQVLNKHR